MPNDSRQPPEGCEFLARLLDTAPVLAAYVDRDLRYRFHNRYYEAFFGLEPNEWVGRAVAEVLAPEAWAQAWPRLLRALAGEPVSYELWLEETADGARTLSVEYVPDRDRTGAVMGVFVVATDVTRLEEAHDALRRGRDALERTVQERTAELERANARLHQLDELKSVFLAAMSHELRTPLNAIIGFTGLLLQAHEEARVAPPDQQDYLQRIQGSSRHLLALVSDAIDVSKVQAGAINANPEAFQLDAVVGETAELIRPAARAKGLALTVRAQTGAELVNDRARFAQCLLNLLSNAVKYTTAGTVEVRAAVDGDLAKVSVSDSGIGIPEQDLGRLFQPFVRLDTPLRLSNRGSGLGLYLARSLANLVLGGDVTVTSTPGQGSTFTLYMRRRMAPAAAQRSLLPAAEHETRGKQ